MCSKTTTSKLRGIEETRWGKDPSKYITAMQDGTYSRILLLHGTRIIRV